MRGPTTTRVGAAPTPKKCRAGQQELSGGRRQGSTCPWSTCAHTYTPTHPQDTRLLPIPLAPALRCPDDCGPDTGNSSVGGQTLQTPPPSLPPIIGPSSMRRGHGALNGNIRTVPAQQTPADDSTRHAAAAPKVAQAVGCWLLVLQQAVVLQHVRTW
jgi:hypothetical protein